MATYTLTLQQIIKDIEIFDFDYPIFSEEYRSTFEQLFKDHFLTDEIAHETIGLFKHRLKTELNLIMPYYNKLYESQELDQRILDNYDVTEVINRVVTGDLSREVNGSNNRKGVSKNLYKDAPKTKIDVDKFDVVTSLTKNEDDNTETNKATETNETNNVENFTRTMKGNIGVQTDADAILKYWQSLRNVTLEIFDKELSKLFMGIY